MMLKEYTLGRKLGFFIPKLGGGKWGMPLRQPPVGAVPRLSTGSGKTTDLHTSHNLAGGELGDLGLASSYAPYNDPYYYYRWQRYGDSIDYYKNHRDDLTVAGAERTDHWHRGQAEPGSGILQTMGFTPKVLKHIRNSYRAAWADFLPFILAIVFLVPDAENRELASRIRRQVKERHDNPAKKAGKG